MDITVCQSGYSTMYYKMQQKGHMTQKQISRAENRSHDGKTY